MADGNGWKPKLADVIKNFLEINDERIRLSYNCKDGYLVFPDFECNTCNDKNIWKNQENFDTANLVMCIEKNIKYLLSIDQYSKSQSSPTLFEQPPLTLEGAAEKIIKACGKPTKYEKDEEPPERIILTYKASTEPTEFNLPYPFKLKSFNESVIFNLAHPLPDSITRR